MVSLSQGLTVRYPRCGHTSARSHRVCWSDGHTMDPQGGLGCGGPTGTLNNG
jgi:hypothetical protein